MSVAVIQSFRRRLAHFSRDSPYKICYAASEWPYGPRRKQAEAEPILGPCRPGGGYIDISPHILYFHKCSESLSYGAFVWERRALDSSKRRFFGPGSGRRRRRDGVTPPQCPAHEGAGARNTGSAGRRRPHITKYTICTARAAHEKAGRVWDGEAHGHPPWGSCVWPPKQCT